MPTASQVSTTWTTCYSEGELRPIEVQVLLRTGIPRFDIIGLPQNMIREGRDRILSALSTLGLDLNAYRVLVSLNPGDIPKEGSHFDLPILVALLRSLGALKPAEQKEFFWGELSLTGDLQPLNDLLAHLLFANQLGGDVFISAPRSTSVDFVSSYLRAPYLSIYRVQDLLELSSKLVTLRFNPPQFFDFDRWIQTTPRDSYWNRLRGSPKQFLLWSLVMLGRHHILVEGAPGCGKTTWCRAANELQLPLRPVDWSRRFQFQPKLSEQAKNLNDLIQAPFEAPHHTSSRAAIIGGGSAEIVAGAISRAHRGILFLDELLEFSRDCLESLREPLESKSITIARRGAMQTLESDIQLLAAMNSCRCGKLGSRFICRCKPGARLQYFQRLSAPLSDRLHLRTSWEFEDLDQPADYNLHNIRRKFLDCPRADEIDLTQVQWKDSRSARHQRNRNEFFTTWCRWFGIRKPTTSDAKDFIKFIDPLETNYETVRKNRAAVQQS